MSSFIVNFKFPRWNSSFSNSYRRRIREFNHNKNSQPKGDEVSRNSEMEWHWYRSVFVFGIRSPRFHIFHSGNCRCADTIEKCYMKSERMQKMLKHQWSSVEHIVHTLPVICHCPSRKPLNLFSIIARYNPVFGTFRYLVLP